MKDCIVITGAGVVSAIGVGKAETLSALQCRRSGIGQVCYLQTAHTELPVGEVKLSNADMQQSVGVPEDAGAALCRNTLLARMALREALDQAGMLDATGHLTDAYDGRMPLISGTTVAGMDLGEQRFTSTEPDEMNRQLLAMHADAGSNTAEIARGVGHFSLLDTLSTACSSALNAIALGANMLKTCRCRQAVVGGTESLSRFHLNGFNTLMILDHETCRPFDQSRAGLNLGEGAAYLVIETLSSALQRGARPLAIISGYGNACDAFHQTASSADGEGAYRAMSQALQMSGLSPADIDYVNAHGTATPNNDPSELAAMHRLFPVLPQYSSTKGYTGHTTSASGSIEAVFCLLALQHQFMPVGLGCTTPIEGEPMPVTATTPLPSHGLRHVMCNAFGFGGNDSSMVFSALPAEGLCMPDTTFAPIRCDIRVIAEHALHEGDADPDFRQYMTAGEARRLGPMLKRTLAVALQTLRDAGTDGQPYVPDAIITGTAWGNTESSGTFLRDMLIGGEALLKPTPFMQSTQNTISSLIAISTHNHGYNNTHSQGSESFDRALDDARMLIELGLIRSVLVSVHDSLPERLNRCVLITTHP